MAAAARVAGRIEAVGAIEDEIASLPADADEEVPDAPENWLPMLLCLLVLAVVAVLVLAV